MPEFEIKFDLLKERERWRRLQDYGCFWSSPDNADGLRLTPVIAPGVVYVDFDVTKNHSGIPRIAHGGLPYVIIDGLMGWLLMSHLGRVGFTTDSSIEYKGPLKVGKQYRLLARFSVESEKQVINMSKKITLEGVALEIERPDKPLVLVKSNFFLPSLSQAQQILGVEIDVDDQKFFGEMG